MSDDFFDDNSISQPEQPQPQQRLIYVGPNNAKLGLERFKVYKGGLPSNIELAIEKLPELIYLLIPVDDLITFNANIQKPGSLEQKYFRLVQEKLKELIK